MDFRKTMIKKRVIKKKSFYEGRVTSWPDVTTQIPVYNEANVVSRVIRAVQK